MLKKTCCFLENAAVSNKQTQARRVSDVQSNLVLTSIIQQKHQYQITNSIVDTMVCE